MSRARNPRSVATVLPPSGALPASGAHSRTYASTCSSASASVTPSASSASNPLEVCMSRTKSPICASADSGGRMTTSTPSPSWFSSKSVTRAATSISASSTRDSPVISQSTHTIRSVSDLPLGRSVGPSAGLSFVALVTVFTLGG